MRPLLFATVFSLAFGAFTADISAAQEDAVARELDPFIRDAFAIDVTPGMGVAVVRGDERVYARGFGFADVEARRPVTTRTLFYIASTSKSFTAFAAALMAERDRLDLDAPIGRYLPRLRLHPPLSADEITLRDLLTHTHGISGRGPVVFRTAYTGVHTDSLLLRLVGGHEPSPTGRAFDYGNIGYNVAALVMDAALDRGWKDLLQQEVFEPAGMTNTTGYRSRVDPHRLAMPYGLNPEGYERLHYGKDDSNMHAAGGHLTTVLDLANWLEIHMNEGRLNGRQIFPADVVAETHRRQATQDREFAEFHRHGWGFGWDLGTYEGDTIIHRFGGFPGFRSHVSFMPAHDIGVVVLTNGGMGSPLADLVATYIYERLLQRPHAERRHREKLARLAARAEEARRELADHRAERVARQQPLPHPPSAYAGTYENPSLGRMEWRVQDGELVVRMGVMKSEAEVYDADSNRLRVELRGGGEVVTFQFDGERAESLTYLRREFRAVD